jgi:hypothetical protein
MPETLPELLAWGGFSDEIGLRKTGMPWRPCLIFVCLGRAA